MEATEVGLVRIQQRLDQLDAELDQIRQMRVSIEERVLLGLKLSGEYFDLLSRQRELHGSQSV